MMKASEIRAGGRGLRIGEVSKASGVGVETLRFYERRGLLGRPARTSANYRVYSRETVERLAFIRRAQLIGFSLDEIQRILAERAEGRTPCRAVREMARRKLDDLDARLRELRRHRKELSDLLDEWGEREDDPGHFCGLIESSRVSAGDVDEDERWRRARKKGGKR